MVFNDLLLNKHQDLWPQFEQLYQMILKNQTHDGDLLLVHLNGFYDPEVHTWNNIEKQSPYRFGHSIEAHSEDTHSNFIGHYIKSNITNIKYPDYLQKLVYSEERREEIDSLEFNESLSIQTEMLIYLKIWESDMFIKKFYQLMNLVSNQSYDWHFDLKTLIKNNQSRGVIIRNKIRDPLKEKLPKLFSSFQNGYKSQIRNAIAHSQYIIIGKNIHLNNYSKNDPFNQIKGLSFKEWTEIFHDTIILHSCYHRFFDTINKNYGICAELNNNAFPIRITRKDPESKIEYLDLYYRKVFQDWGFYPEK